MSLITQLADEDDGIRDRAEALALRGEPTAHADTLKQRLERWKRARHFISYSESTAFARQLDIWLDELEEELLAVNPEATWELADAFLRSDRQVFDRADDSKRSNRRCLSSVLRPLAAGCRKTWGFPGLGGPSPQLAL